jgi:hypothetical protein
MNHRAASRAVSKIATPKNGAASCGVFTSRESGIKIPLTIGRLTESQDNEMNDTSRIESVMQTFYEAISGYPGEDRDWDSLRSLFAPGASLVPSSVVCSNLPPSAIGIEAYVQRLAGFLSQHDFFETGFVHRIEMYGNMACIISTYEARHTPNDSEPFKRGVNFIQMLNDGKRWWLTSMIWRDEDKENSIPEKYRNPADVP